MTYITLKLPGKLARINYKWYRTTEFQSYGHSRLEFQTGKSQGFLHDSPSSGISWEENGKSIDALAPCPGLWDLSISGSRADEKMSLYIPHGIWDLIILLRALASYQNRIQIKL